MSKRRKSVVQNFGLPDPEEVTKAVAETTGQPTEEKPKPKPTPKAKPKTPPKPQKRKVGRPPATHGRIPISTMADPDKWEEIKILAIRQKKQVADLVNEAFQLLMKKYNK